MKRKDLSVLRTWTYHRRVFVSALVASVGFVVASCVVYGLVASSHR